MFDDVWNLVFYDNYIRESTNKFAAIKSLKFLDYPNIENKRIHDDDTFTEIFDTEPIPIIKDNFVPISA